MSERNWLRAIIDDVERRALSRSAWAMSEHAQEEIAKLRAGRTSRRDQGEAVSAPTAGLRAKLQPHNLTCIAEALGKREPPPLRWLASLARHPSAAVREGAVYGLAPHVAMPFVRVYLEVIASHDPSPGVREAASEALEA